MENDKGKQLNVEPSKLDEMANEKNILSGPRKSDLLKENVDGLNENDKSDLGNADDGVSSVDAEGVQLGSSNNVSDAEARGLDDAASRMPEYDDILDHEFLDDEDNSGTQLNESDDALGGDLDISEEDADANIYDNNE